MNEMTINDSGVNDKRVRVFIVDDHPFIREGLTLRIEREPDLTVCGESNNAAQALKSIGPLMPDVLIVDLSLKGKSGLHLIKDVVRKFPELPILVLSMLDEMVYAERALRAGAMGYIMKQEATKKVITAIRGVMAGKLFVNVAVTSKIMHRLVSDNDKEYSSSIDLLSDRELEAFKLIGTGFSTHQISKKMKVGLRLSKHIEHASNQNLILRALMSFCNTLFNGRQETYMGTRRNNIVRKSHNQT